MANERQRRSTSERLGLLEQWQQSGQTAREFAARVELNASLLYSWRKQLKAAAIGGPEARERAPAFAELRLSSPQAAHGTIEVVARNGRVIRVHGEISAHALQRVLAAVEEC